MDISNLRGYPGDRRPSVLWIPSPFYASFAFTPQCRYTPKRKYFSGILWGWGQQAFKRLIYTSSLWFPSAVLDQFRAVLTLPVQFCLLLMNVCPVSLVQKDKLSVCDKSFVWTLIIINDKKLLGRNYKHFGPEQEQAEKMEKLSSLLLAKQHLSFLKLLLTLLQIEHCSARGTMKSSVAFLYQINCMPRQTLRSKYWLSIKVSISSL